MKRLSDKSIEFGLQLAITLRALASRQTQEGVDWKTTTKAAGFIHEVARLSEAAKQAEKDGECLWCGSTIHKSQMRSDHS